MPKQLKTGDLFARLILVILLSVSICQALYTSLFLTNKLNGTILICIIPLSLLFAVLFINRITSLISGIVMVLALILCTSYVIYLLGIGQGEKLFIYVNWFIDLVNGYPDFTKTTFNMVTVVLMSFFVTFLVFLFTVKFYNFYLLCIFALSVFFIQLQFKILNSPVSFIFFIFSFLMLYFYQVLKTRNKKQNFNIGNPVKYLLLVTPLCIAIVFISLVLPVRENRISWKWLDKKADNIVVNTSNTINDKLFNTDTSSFDYFSLEATGFGNSDRLGGNIKLSKKQVMDVRSEFSNVYLKGSTKSSYDGARWYEETNSSSELIPRGYTYEIGGDSPYRIVGNNISKNSDIEITYTNLKTKTVFIPDKTYTIFMKQPLSLSMDKMNIVSSSEMLGKGFSYSVSYDNMNLNSEELKSMFRQSYTGMNQRLIIQLLNSINSQASENKAGIVDHQDALEKFANIADFFKNIYIKYTTLPGTITYRTRELAYQITDDYSNNYDRAKAIETYLSQNYPYTLTPGKPPRSQDFVDYFLFDGKRGYCTYYASAMVVLLRCINIPARYVEGYILPPTSQNGVYKVTNQQAHAWVEAYFEGFGWIPFEPTSPFVSNLYKDNTIKANISADMNKGTYDDYMDMINQYRQSEPVDKPFDTNDLPVSNQQNKKLALMLFIVKITLALMICIILLFLTRVIYKKIQFNKYMNKLQASSSNQAALLLYDYILRILKLYNLSYKPGETPSKFGERVERQLDIRGYTLGKLDFIKVSNCFINARYSQAELNQADKKNMLEFIGILLKLTREKISKTKYIIYRYILGKI